MSKPRSVRPSRDTVPCAVEAVRRRIEHWRTTRDRRRRMPAPLWEAAAAVARDHGLWFVSRALRVNYESLKKHVESLAEESGVVAGFVEVRGEALVGQSAAATTVLEMSSGDGARLTVRLEGHESLDVPALVDAFWQHHR